MTRVTSMAVMLVVLLGLGGYIYFFQFNRRPTIEVKPKAVDIKQDEIEQFVIKSASGDVSTIVKTGGTWQITSPITATADPAVMARLVTVLSGLEITRVVEEHPTEVAPFGLAPPHGEITVKTTGAAGTQQVLLGAKAPVGGAVYAQLPPNPRVFLISSDLEEAANKTPLELRHNGMFTLDRDSLDSLEIDAAGRGVHLVKRDLDWDLTAPLQTRGDLGVASELLTKLMAQKMDAIVEAPVLESPIYHLGKPVATVTIAAGDRRETLQVGGKADASSTYARNLSRPMVFTIPNSLVEALKSDPANYRRKDVFVFQTNEATRLEVLRDGQTTTYEKATAPGSDGKWRELSPHPRDLDQTKIDTALSKLSYLRAVGFVPTPAGLTSGPGVMALVVKFDEGKKSDSVRLAKPGAEPLAVRDDWPDAAKLDSSAYGLLIAALDDLAK